MRTYLRGKFTLLFLMLGLMLALPAAAWAAVTIDTSVDLSTSVATPTNVQIGSNSFNIKVWGTNGSLGSGDGKVTVGNAYSMSTAGAITQTGTTTVTLPAMNYSQCPATGGTQGCPGNPFVVPSTLTVAAGTADGKTGTLTVTQSVASGSGITLDSTPASGQVKVVNPQPTKQKQTITFGALGGKTYGDPDFNVSATASSNLPVSFAASGACSVSGNTVHITGAGNCDITASQAGDASYNPAPNVVQSFLVAKAQATVALGDLHQVYNGDPRPVSVSTTPTGLNVGVTYNGSTTAPTNAGSYNVVATINEDNYQGGTTGTLVVDKADQTITFVGPSNKTFGDADFGVSATATSGLPVSFEASGNCTVTGSTVHITGAGSCTVTAKQGGNGNYNAAPDVARTFTIAKAPVDVTLHDLGPYTYDNTAHSASATTNGPAGLTVNITYDGSSTAPTNAGSYDVVATVDDPNYQGSNSGTLTIDKAASTTTVTCTPGPFTYNGSAHTPCSAKVTGPGGLNLTPDVVYANNVNAGQASASYTYDETANYLGSSDSKTFTIDKANATVNVNGYTGVYDGNAHGATGTATGVKDESLDSLLHLGDSFTNVPGGTANWTFDGNGNYNSKSGSVQINISKATPTITWNNPAPIDYGTALSATHLNATAKGVDGNSLTGNFDYTPNAGTVLLQGTRELNVQFTPASNNYNTASKTVQIVVNPYPFNGFFQPIDNGIYNSAKAGSTIPVKFSLGGDKGLNIFLDNKVPTTQKITCDTSTPVDAIEELSTATTSGLKYDPVANQYIYNWKTATSYAGTCQRLTVTLADGSTAKSALFKFTK